MLLYLNASKRHVICVKRLCTWHHIRVLQEKIFLVWIYKVQNPKRKKITMETLYSFSRRHIQIVWCETAFSTMLKSNAKQSNESQHSGDRCKPYGFLLQVHWEMTPNNVAQVHTNSENLLSYILKSLLSYVFQNDVHFYY